ncbi:hypothetical protein QLQ15_11120 [Lysobacter sp. LF1]|uniref:Restriction endonuclease n=1 Tax=Lysobacter stagni TaxID=3045172 RepID=A0ABT6XH21_9GAMM|nr:hypothetical protein [Lysobacter sp. LF1]MDI9239454.1 hypothetical protein [Lysobacter sp. LF1]
MIFSDIERTDAGPKLSRETEFGFMNRSARPEIAAVRCLLEQLAGEYPASEQSDLVSRFRSGDDAAYKSAEFELILHATLRRRGYELEPHPTLPNGSSARPDFLVTTPDGSKFYLEAINPSETNEDMSGDKLTEQTLDVLSTHAHRNFLVGVKTRGHPKTQPSRKKFLQCVLRWLDGLDPDAVDKDVKEHGFGDQPTMTWRHEELEIEVSAIPIRPERRGKSERLLGIHSGGAGWISPKTPVRDAIRFKGTKYGRLDQPFVIAVNHDGYGLRRDDEVEALFGDEVIVFQVNAPNDDGQLRRKPNGAWVGANGPEFTRVSGAWIFDRLSPYTLTEQTGTLYFNPFAANVAPLGLREFAHAYGIDGQLVWSDGPTIGDILGLTKDWLNPQQQG